MTTFLPWIQHGNKMYNIILASANGEKLFGINNWFNLTSISLSYISNSINFGNTWSTDISISEYMICACASADLSHIYLGSMTPDYLSGSIYLFNGTLNKLSPTFGFNAITCSKNGQYIYAGAMHYDPNVEVPGAIMQSIDYGNNWTTTQIIENWHYMACSATGQYVFGFTASRLYLSTDYGNSYNITSHIFIGIKSVSVSDDASYLYVVDDGIYLSRDAGLSWNTVFSGPNYNTISCDSSGLSVYYNIGSYAHIVMDYLNNHYISNDALSSYTEIGQGDLITDITFQSGVITRNGAYIILTAVSAVSNLSGMFTSGVQIHELVLCFKEGTKILTDKGYVCIEDLCKNDLVKTELNGCISIKEIGWSNYDMKNIFHAKNKLHLLKNDNFPELIEDLIITGCHSILVPELSPKQRALILDDYKIIYITGNRYRLPAYICDKTQIYEGPCKKIWHLALENANEQSNYGIYANGLLVESCSIRTIQLFSGMTLL